MQRKDGEREPRAKHHSRRKRREVGGGREEKSDTTLASTFEPFAHEDQICSGDTVLCRVPCGLDVFYLILQIGTFYQKKMVAK